MQNKYWANEQWNNLAPEVTLESIGAASNKNLLINWDFSNPINQQGSPSYSINNGYMYCMDRWIIDHCAITVATKITLTGNAINGHLKQYINGFDKFKGKVVTFSIKALAGTGIGAGAHISIVDGITTETTPIISIGIVTVTKTIDLQATELSVNIVTSNTTTGKTVQVQSAKLELGSKSTLISDPPANYTEEFLKSIQYDPITGNMVYSIPATRFEGITTLEIGNWIGSSAPYTYQLYVFGLLTTDTPHIGCITGTNATTGAAIKTAWGLITNYGIEPQISESTIIFYAGTKPTIAIPIIYEVIR